MKETRYSLTPKNNLPGWITLADIPERGTTLIMQRYLQTHIETQIDAEEGMALAKALLEHFALPAPTTIPHGHGPVGGFYALLDEARAQDHQNIQLSRGHANLLAEHIRLLEEQLGALQAQVNDPERVRRLNEHTYIVDLLGHVEDGSDQVITVGQDDATKRWFVNASGNAQYGDSLIAALRKHFIGHTAKEREAEEAENWVVITCQEGRDIHHNGMKRDDAYLFAEQWYAEFGGEFPTVKRG